MSEHNIIYEVLLITIKGQFIGIALVWSHSIQHPVLLQNVTQNIMIMHIKMAGHGQQYKIMYKL